MMPELLETERLKLRPFGEDDAMAVFGYWASDPDWPRFNLSVPADFTESDAEKWVAEVRSRVRESDPSWAVVLGVEVIGVVTLAFERGHRMAVIGYGIHGQFRGNGYSGEASKTVIDRAFEAHSQLQKIRANTDPRNVGSHRVLEKLGFSREGIRKFSQPVKGESVDGEMFGLPRGDWLGRGL